MSLKLLQPMVHVPEGHRLRCFCDRFEGDDPLQLAIHALGCTSISEMRTHRHNDMRDLLARSLRTLRAGAQINTEVVLPRDRKGVVEGKRVSVRVDLGGRRDIKKQTTIRIQQNL